MVVAVFARSSVSVFLPFLANTATAHPQGSGSGQGSTQRSPTAPWKLKAVPVASVSTVLRISHAGVLAEVVVDARGTLGFVSWRTAEDMTLFAYLADKLDTPIFLDNGVESAEEMDRRLELRELVNGPRAVFCRQSVKYFVDNFDNVVAFAHTSLVPLLEHFKNRIIAETGLTALAVHLALPGELPDASSSNEFVLTSRSTSRPPPVESFPREPEYVHLVFGYCTLTPCMQCGSHICSHGSCTGRPRWRCD